VLGANFGSATARGEARSMTDSLLTVYKNPVKAQRHDIPFASVRTNFGSRFYGQFLPVTEPRSRAGNRSWRLQIFAAV
jgi:hypothetical protein